MVADSDKPYAALITVSLLAHLLAFSLLAMTTPPRGFRARPVKNIGVDLIGAAEFEKLFSPPPVEEPPTTSVSPTVVAPETPQELPPPVVRKPEAKAPQPVIAQSLQLGRLLDAPENRELKESLVLFDPSEQREQLCNLEVMEQIQLWNGSFNPERVVAFAYKDPVAFADTVTAEGAAFRSKGEWYHLSYKCTWDPSTNLVTALEFLAGELIPHSEWDDHFLFAD
ncbi:hypothetical protein GCM10007094_34250 [Pseudovibrio japonicus]|uniref:DUF930 domain-containing protein n=1 Tax=Pseudovibrio japonicus TaxID=366534 RepID=A0ABQ3EJ16_9HYPH|nr:hypothetical protein GCM10007094_34250 [Pseudovibrio japonicus]